MHAQATCGPPSGFVDSLKKTLGLIAQLVKLGPHLVRAAGKGSQARWQHEKHDPVCLK